MPSELRRVWWCGAFGEPCDETCGRVSYVRDDDCALDDPRTLLAAALASDEGKAALAEALQGWWAAPEGSMPGTTEWTNAGGWLGDARAIAAELAKETPA